MRKLLILSLLTLVAASATGCSSNPCGDSWRPGYYLFGWGRNQHPVQCCDPCGGGGVMGAPMMSAPCCQ
ncbi:MAG TPA: hypothetical protein VGZ26_10270 [Pirellulales bacterium]|nr:hypothetical protein [Pirellulales bacterium]